MLCKYPNLLPFLCKFTAQGFNQGFCFFYSTNNNHKKRHFKQLSQWIFKLEIKNDFVFWSAVTSFQLAPCSCELTLLCSCVPAGPQDDDSCKVLVLSYPQYCRYRSMLARLREQPSSLLVDHAVLALGGIAAVGANTRILYCRDTFDHPALLHNKSICDQFGELTVALLFVLFFVLWRQFGDDWASCD